VTPPLQKFVMSQGAPSGQHLSQVLTALEAQSAGLETTVPFGRQAPVQQRPRVQLPAAHSSSVRQLAARPFLEAQSLWLGPHGLQAIWEAMQPNTHGSVSVQEPSVLQVWTAVGPHCFDPGLHVPSHVPWAQTLAHAGPVSIHFP
jgi:hypothetical protein